MTVGTYGLQALNAKIEQLMKELEAARARITALETTDAALLVTLKGMSKVRV
jgi:outer membrane murein-binding lipoprotein Lpp